MSTRHFVASGVLALSLVALVLAPVAHAGGPLILFDEATRTPYAYPGPVDMHTDLGPLGAVANADADLLVDFAAAEWSGVPTSSFSASVVGDFAGVGLPDINGTNAGLVIGTDNTGGGLFVIYDTDGSVTQNFLGAPPGVLGVASPEFAAPGSPDLTESWIVLNGATINPGDLPGADSWTGVITHEMGHSINLAHTQANGAIIFFGDERAPGGCLEPYPTTIGLAATETMFPFIDPSPGSTGVAQATVEHPDDTATLSDLYPAAGYPGNFGTIEGRVFDADGVTELVGVNVIARNLADPFFDSQSALSGDFTQGAIGPDGFYRLTGLTPGATYVLYIDEIVQGGYSTPPRQPLGAPEEFWNVGEGNNDLVDPPCDFDGIVVAAGQTVTADFELNAAAPPPQIGVAPSGFSFSVPVDGSASDVLTISNDAPAGGLDLEWTLVDAVSAIAAPADPGVEVSLTRLRPVRGDVVGTPEILDPHDPARLRQCTDCGGDHAKRSTPLGFGAAARAVGTITDGSFELGPFGGAWTESSTNFGTPICDATTCGTGGLLGPRTGTFWTWFGGIAAVEIGSVSQSVTIPGAASTTIDFWYDVGGCDSPADFMELRIDGTPVWTIDGSAVNCDGAGYAFASVDVSSFADGGTHTVEFVSEIFATNGAGSNFFLDDVSLVQASSDCPWLSAAPLSGTVVAGTSGAVTVSVDATGLAPGLYSCQLQISSNDPVTPSVTVPVELEVVDVQEITVNVFPEQGLNGAVSIYSSPDGSGDPLTAAQLWDGVPGSAPLVVDATIVVELLDGAGAPVVGFPAESIRVASSAGGWVQCDGLQLVADAPTDAAGRTTISGLLFAGGHSAPGELMQVIVDDPTVVATNYPGGSAGLDYRVNGPDLDGDLFSTIADVGAFAAFYAGSYDYSADYVWNGQLSIGDVGRLASGVGAACPPVPPTLADDGDTDRDRPELAEGARMGIVFAGGADAAELEPGVPTDAWIVLEGPAAEAGIQGFDARIRTSDNVVVHDRKLLVEGLDLADAQDFIVGLTGGDRAHEGRALRLAHLRVSVTDDRPAYFWLEATDRSLAGVPSLARDGEWLAATPVSGAVDLPVASLNDVSFVAGNTGSAVRTLSLDVAPNPFNPRTEIRFRLPDAGPVELIVIDARGQRVTTLAREVMPAGEHVFVWDGTDGSGQRVASGVYFSSLRSASGARTEKMLLVK